MRKTLRFVSVVALLVSLASGPYIWAVCARTSTSWTGYYDGCGQTPTWNGERGWDCEGIIVSNGTLDGHWKEVMTASCGVTPQWQCHQTTEYVYKYYEKCNGSWVQRTQAAFFSGDCQCS